MYASNEDEFQGEHDDWVFLRRTPPATTVLNAAMNLINQEPINSSSSANSGSSNSSDSSSKSDRSDSLSSLTSNEREHIQHDEQENYLVNEDPVLNSQNNDDTHDLLSIGENKEDVLPTEIIIKQSNENETTPVINEYDLINNGQDISQEPVEPEIELRRRTGANVQHSTEEHPITTEHEYLPSSTSFNRPKIHQALATYLCFILIFITLVILSQMIISQKSTIYKLKHQLEITNEQLNNMKQIKMEKLEQKLTKQLEHRFESLNKQMKSEFQREKSSLILQIRELNQRLNLLQQNLTNQIHQLSDENHQLQDQMIVFKQQLKTIEEQHSKENYSCPEGIDCNKSTIPTMDVLLSHLLKQTASIAEDTSANLSGLFEQLSVSLSDLVDHGQEYVEESKRKLTDLAGSSTAEHVQTTIRRGVENISSSLRKAQSTYVTWLRKRAQERDQARMDQLKQDENTNRRPWRWTFQRSQEREQMRHQKPITKKHTDKKDYVCQSNCRFPVNHICTMRNWMEKLFHP